MESYSTQRVDIYVIIYHLPEPLMQINGPSSVSSVERKTAN